MSQHLFEGRDGAIYACACQRGGDHSQADDDEAFMRALATPAPVETQEKGDQ